MAKMVIHQYTAEGVVAKTEKLVSCDDEIDYSNIIAEIRDDLNALPGIIDWYVVTYDDDGNEINRTTMDDGENVQFFYLLTNEGYKFNSQIRDNMDVIVHRLYRNIS